MKNRELVDELKRRDAEGEVQIFIRNEHDETAYEFFNISRVDGFINGPDTVLEAGEVIRTAD
jgi:hypothetical protein